MEERLRLDIEPPTNGWAVVRLSGPGVAVEFAASYTPRDTISELASAALGLMAGAPDQVVICNTEPAEYEFHFESSDGRSQLLVRLFPDRLRQREHAGALVAKVEGETVEIARALWRGLRRLQGAASAETFLANWKHSFPAAALERLGGQIQRRTPQRER